MTLPPYPRFLSGSYVSQSPFADCELTINFYPEQQAAPGEQPHFCLYPTPGVETHATSTGTQGRASFSHKGHGYAVISGSFGEITSTGLFTVLGPVAVDSHPATISTNGDGGGQLMITSGGDVYIWDLTALTLTNIAVPFTATMGAQIDGYFLALDTATSTLYLSDLLDGTTWDPTQFAQRSIRPDPWVAVHILDRYIWLLGVETSEVWYNAGTFPFPFAPHPSGLVAYGCVAPFSAKVVAEALMWLAQTRDGSGQVVRAAGFSPDVVSTAPLQVALASYATIADAIGDTYQDLGHTFYILTLPAANATHVWDVNTGLWHGRGLWLSEFNRYDAWRPIHHVFAFGKHLTLDRASGLIYHLTSDVLIDAESRPIRRLRRAPMLMSEQRVFLAAFELRLESGLGLITGQGSDPQVMLRISEDGGKTWGNEHWQSAGKIGEYTRRVRWVRLGMSRQGMVFEISTSDPVAFRLTGATIVPRARAQAA